MFLKCKWNRKLFLKVLIHCILLDCAKQCAMKTKVGQLKDMSRSISIRKQFTIEIFFCNGMNINDIILGKYIDYELRF